jgi:hypothetical protein
VDNTVAHLFDINYVVKVIRILVEGLGDGIRRGCSECKVDDMVEGLACNIGWSLGGMETDGWQGGL